MVNRDKQRQRKRNLASSTGDVGVRGGLQGLVEGRGPTNLANPRKARPSSASVLPVPRALSLSVFACDSAAAAAAAALPLPLPLYGVTGMSRRSFSRFIHSRGGWNGIDSRDPTGSHAGAGWLLGDSGASGWTADGFPPPPFWIRTWIRTRTRTDR
ncbi:hypothetical protein VDGL01_07207 [Verticillium dahliae]